MFDQATADDSGDVFLTHGVDDYRVIFVSLRDKTTTRCNYFHNSEQYTGMKSKIKVTGSLNDRNTFRLYFVRRQSAFQQDCSKSTDTTPAASKQAS